MKAKIKRKDKLFIGRDILNKLMLIEGEHAEIYAFICNKTKEVIYIDYYPKCAYINIEQCECYKTTCKKLYLYFLMKEYPNLSRVCLVIYANRLIRRMPLDAAAKLLKITELEYQNLESGKIVNFDLEKLANMLNFQVEEFYYDFNSTFKKIT